MKMTGRKEYSRAFGVALGLGVLLVCLASAAAFAGPLSADVTNAPDLGLMITANDLEGSSVVDLSGAEVARIEGLFINPKSGQVEFVALRFEDKGTTLALPWSAIAFEGAHAILDATERQIERAPRVGASMLEGKSETRTRMEKTPASTASETEPVETMRGYAPLRAYEQRFDPKRIETFHGVIRGTIVEPLEEPNAVDEIAFLETGPQSNVLLALVGDRAVELRTKNGIPLWRQSS
jgi:sporulation protein YlmC with PRC-barrel domain